MYMQTYYFTRTHHSDSESTSLCFSLHNTTCSATNINFKVFVLTQPETESTFYHIRNEYASIKSLRRLLKQKLHTLPEHMSSPSVFSGVRVTRSLVLYVCFVDRCLSFSTSSFGRCVLLRFTDSDYSFGIFKLFFIQSYLKSYFLYRYLKYSPHVAYVIS